MASGPRPGPLGEFVMVAWSGVFGFCFRFLGCWVVVVWSGVPRWSGGLVLVSWAVFGGVLGIW